MIDNIHDFTNRLGDCIVLLGGKPGIFDKFYEESGYIVGQFRYLPTKGGDVVSVNVFDRKSRKVNPNISLSSPRIGYVNIGYDETKHRAIYVNRVPKRQWRVGLSLNNTTPNIGDWLYSDSMRSALLNIYPSLHEARDICMGSLLINPSCAFSRDLAISIGDFEVEYLVYKGKTVGHFYGSHVKLSEHYMFLKEYLEYCDLKVGEK